VRRTGFEGAFLYTKIIMAKELPYFKFEPNQWENGNIQICSREDKGLFMDLCSMYWSRLGDLPLKLAVNKLCAGNATAFDSLIKEQIFTVIDGLVCIDYLNEQLSNFDETSKTNSKNAKEGWEKRRKQREESDRNATALNPQCESDAIREEERREEKIKVNKFIPPTADDVKAYCDLRNNNVNVNKFIDFYESKGWFVGKNKMKDWKASVRTWEKDSIESPKQQNTINLDNSTPEQIAEFLRKRKEEKMNQFRHQN
jgi:hypothetical protein